MRNIYTLGIYLMLVGIRMAQFRKAKLQLWLKGREQWVQKMRKALANESADLLWFHVASLGEFEQGRELMEACRLRYPQKKIFLTFFSPSGYEVCKNTPVADYIFYLPADLPREVNTFLDIVKPQAAIFIKYEYWFNYMNALHKRQIPFYYVAAKFRPEQYFFKPLGVWFRKHLTYASGFFVQDQSSQTCLQKMGVQKVWVAGDTRFDRVMRLLEEDASYPIVERFIEKQTIIIGGSIWDEDGYLMRDCNAKESLDFKWLLVPHEIKNSRINGLQKDARVEGCVRYSEIKQKTEEEWRVLDDARVLVVDEVGMLSKLYRYGHMAYIGGGFGRGIHNTLEAAVYGLPIIFGPHYTHFKEAVDLVNMGAAFCVKDAQELGATIRFLADENHRKKASIQAAAYVKEHAGAVDMVMKELSSQW